MMANLMTSALVSSLPQQNVHTSDGPVAILWDMENCRIPSDVCPEDVAGNIRMALRMHPVINGAVNMFSAYGDFNGFSRRLREGCQRTGVKLVDVPNGRKDAADKAILVDMFLFALDNPPPCSIMLISGDVDFSPALHVLGQRGYTVILVIPSRVGVSSALSNAGSYVWDWASVVRGEGFLPSLKSQISENTDPINEEEAIVYKGISMTSRSSTENNDMMWVQPGDLTHKITNQEVELGTLPACGAVIAPVTDNKRKWNDSDKASNYSQQQKRANNNNNNRNFNQSSSTNQNQGSTQNQGSYLGKQPKCNKCNYHHHGQCTKTCQRCKKVGHMAKDCRAPFPKQQQQQQQRQQQQQHKGNRKGCFQCDRMGCFKCGSEDHFKRDCPQQNQNANNSGNDNTTGNHNNNNNNNNNGGNGAHGRAFTIGAGDAMNDNNVVTGTSLHGNLQSGKLEVPWGAPADENF
ncbi:putative transcription factor interactor and regulator CCHC(Zn) family [Helianthus annuus]|nr:putative transcription factor interactor and regulator CCHC(Zn) family [Helianthus annuus]